jgi:cellulose synthase/poly-beta-1,6-N-acetylglucosamine synthase-like glycosyltransferase
MLSRALYLSAGWFAISLLVTLVLGSRLRRGNATNSVAWLVAIVLVGDLGALIVFTNPLEIFVISWLALPLGLFWIMRLRDWNALGQITWTMSLLVTGLFIVYAFMLTAFSPLNPLSFLLALVFFFIETITLLLALTHLYESLDVVCRIRWHRLTYQIEPIPGYVPKVSLHVPAYNEPIEVVKKTLLSLAELNYPDFEVLVVDNNTPLEATWRPLEKICRNLGANFHCLHLASWPGYKSGALNFALAQTDPQAEIIGIIDADYQVEPNFLQELIPAFADPELAFLQTPQDYSDYKGNLFSESTYRGYKYFFEVSMPSRNEHNAIIFAGTMGLIRKSVLEEIGGWDEWCITEDAEASLRILKRGYKSLYIHKSFGRGLMPFDFEGLKKQRFRWCFGGIQILKKHWEALMPWAHWVEPENKLTFAQRYHYLVGGLGWFTDVFNLLFAFFLVLGALFSLLASPVQVRPLTNTLMILPAVFLLLHIWRFLWVLRNRLKLSFGMAMSTMHNFFSLGWAVTLACIQGIIQKEGVFLRTPKSQTRSRLWHALRVTQWETAIGLVCAAAGLLAFSLNPNFRTFTLGSLLFWQGSLYLAAPFYSMISTRSNKAAYPARVIDQGAPVQEHLAARWVVGLLIGMIFSLSLIRILPFPAGLPWYARYMPVDLHLELSPIRVTNAEQLNEDQPDSEPVPLNGPVATVSIHSTHCWSGPGSRYKKLDLLLNGQELQIIGKNADPNNPWWYVTMPDTNEKCWLWFYAATTMGPVDDVPIIDIE